MHIFQTILKIWLCSRFSNLISPRSGTVCSLHVDPYKIFDGLVEDISFWSKTSIYQTTSAFDNMMHYYSSRVAERLRAMAESLKPSPLWAQSSLHFFFCPCGWSSSLPQILRLIHLPNGRPELSLIILKGRKFWSKQNVSLQKEKKSIGNSFKIYTINGSACSQKVPV